jgi:hypothetical protein
VSNGHGGFARRVPCRSRFEIASEELVGCHCKKDVLISAPAEVKHLASGIKAKHGVFPLKLTIALVNVEIEAKPRVGPYVGKDRGKADRVGDSKMVIDQGRGGVHLNLADAHFKGELIVYVNAVTVSKEGKNVDILLVIKGLESGKWETARFHLHKTVDDGRLIEGVADDLAHNFRLKGLGVIGVNCESIRNEGNVGGPCLLGR